MYNTERIYTKQLDFTEQPCMSFQSSTTVGNSPT